LKGGGYEGKKEFKTEDKYQIPEYREPKNNPMIPKIQKTIFSQNQVDKPPYQGKKAPDPILNLQLYEKPRPKPKPKQDAYPHPAVFYPNYVPNPFNPVEYANYMHTTRGYGGTGGYGGPGPVGGPTFKEYNINIGGVSGSHVKTSMLFEDALPMKQISASFSTLGERNTMYEFIRSIMFSKGDGEDLPIDDSNYNLLSHLKFMDMNPYNSSRLWKNPYRGLPYGFLLYRSCYPIRHDERNATTMCAKNSTGINVRIYRMTEGSYQVNKNERSMNDHDLWRDMSFYDYVKDQIVKPKICPNFMIMYGYNITLDSKIDFETINTINRHKSIKNDYIDNSQRTSGMSANQTSFFGQLMKSGKADNKIDKNRANRHKIITELVNNGSAGYPLARSANDLNNQYKGINCNGQPGQIVIEETKEKLENDLNTYRGKVLVCLTEAPNYSIMDWARKQYRADGNVKRMINTGYHPAHVWESVLFQLLAALYTMQIKGIVIDKFNLKRNVFIKDIESHNKATTYWRYVIEGVEYYVPNYGYLVMVDTNYRDCDEVIDCNEDANPDRLPRKIDGSIFSTTKLKPDEIFNKVFEIFKSTIDPNQFEADFVKDDGIKPPEAIMKLLTTIKRNIGEDNKSISSYIRSNMTMYLNNRVGTQLTVDEIPKVTKGGVKEFRNGELVVMADENNRDKFVIYVNKKDGDIARIITRDGITKKSNIIEKDVSISSLNKYADIPIQSFDDKGASLNAEPIEEYVISAN
jgi:hypothetical protein